MKQYGRTRFRKKTDPKILTKLTTRRLRQNPHDKGNKQPHPNQQDACPSLFAPPDIYLIELAQKPRPATKKEEGNAMPPQPQLPTTTHAHAHGMLTGNRLTQVMQIMHHGQNPPVTIS